MSEKAGVPDDRVSLTVSDVSVVCEQDGVVLHHWITGRQDSLCSGVYAFQDAVINQKVVH